MARSTKLSCNASEVFEWRIAMRRKTIHRSLCTEYQLIEMLLLFLASTSIDIQSYEFAGKGSES
jgi:hypothetical protein